MNGRVWIIFWLLAIAAFIGLFLWVGKLPPSTIRMAVGQQGGSNEDTAQQLKAILAKSGVTVELVQTHGSADNIARLTATGKDAIDAAILQSGLPNTAETPGIANLGAMYLQPIWIFGRRLPPGLDIRRLIGKRVATGNPTSAGHALIDRLLAENGIGEKDITQVPLGGKAAADALLAGKVDAAWIGGGFSSEWVQTLLASPELELVSFERAEGYARRHSFLVSTVLAQGVIDLGRNMPGHDLKLIGPTAQLIVRQNLHPALQSLLLDAIHVAFSDGDAVSKPGLFPNQYLIDIPLSDEARRYYASGPSFLRRVLPYWAANFAERALLFMIPLVTLLFPLAQAAPPLYDWRIKRRIHALYRQLRLLETRGLGARTVAEIEDVRQTLESMLRDVGGLRVPTSYADDVYRLRAHIRFVMEFIKTQAKSVAA